MRRLLDYIDSSANDIYREIGCAKRMNATVNKDKDKVKGELIMEHIIKPGERMSQEYQKLIDNPKKALPKLVNSMLYLERAKKRILNMILPYSSGSRIVHDDPEKQAKILEKIQEIEHNRERMKLANKIFCSYENTPEGRKGLRHEFKLTGFPTELIKDGKKPFSNRDFNNLKANLYYYRKRLGTLADCDVSIKDWFENGIVVVSTFDCHIMIVFPAFPSRTVRDWLNSHNWVKLNYTPGWRKPISKKNIKEYRSIVMPYLNGIGGVK